MIWGFGVIRGCELIQTWLFGMKYLTPKEATTETATFRSEFFFAYSSSHNAPSVFSRTAVCFKTKILEQTAIHELHVLTPRGVRFVLSLFFEIQ